MGNVKQREVEEGEKGEGKLLVCLIWSGECPFYSGEERPWLGGEVSHDDASTGAQRGWRWRRRVGAVRAVTPGLIAVKTRP